ncbi:MAG: hypothetical protein KDB07_07135 [Planctomycetes bacterium]|nr:hypothetical protein [Planctomycetota bacterium]
MHETPGVVGAWIEASALDDRGKYQEITMVVAMDEGFETSDALEVEGQTLVIAGVACDVLRDTLEIDPELVEILAKGYRLCGVDREIFELSALAGEITGRPSF